MSGDAATLYRHSSAGTVRLGMGGYGRLNFQQHEHFMARTTRNLRFVEHRRDQDCVTKSDISP